MNGYSDATIWPRLTFQRTVSLSHSQAAPAQLAALEDCSLSTLLSLRSPALNPGLQKAACRLVPPPGRLATAAA